MTNLSTASPQPVRPPSPSLGAARRTARAELFAEILPSCADVTPACAVALLGPNAPDYVIALAARGFARAITITKQCRLAHDLYHCICLMDGTVDDWSSVRALASLKGQLAPAGSLVLDISDRHGDSEELVDRLRDAGFLPAQIVVLALPAPGERDCAVLLVAQVPCVLARGGRKQALRSAPVEAPMRAA